MAVFSLVPGCLAIGFGYAVLVNAIGQSLGKPKALYVLRLTAFGGVFGLVAGVVIEVLKAFGA